MIYTSASQLETLDLCARKHYFKSVLKLPVMEKKDAAAFGTALHGVAERYLTAKSDLYPEGWDVVEGVRLDPRDSVLIRLLIQKAIDAGYLERRHGMAVEGKFEMKLADDMVLVGYMDHAGKDRVEDHKTSKSTRYFKSPETLKKNIQMMVYAKHLIEEATRRGEKLGVISLVHNQYLRDYNAPEVRRREAEVYPEEAHTFWREVIQPLLQKQREMIEIKNPFDIPDPPPKACNAYGGCPFLSICSRGETVDAYRKRLTINEKPMTEVKPKNPAEFVAERLAKSKAATTTAINPPLPAAAPSLPTQDPPEAVEAPGSVGTPPWSHAGCPLCKKRPKRPGFKDDGTVCRICVTLNNLKLEDIAAKFTWEAQEDGTVQWWEGAKPVTIVRPGVAPVEDTGQKKAYGLDDLYAELKAASGFESVMALATKAKGVLGDSSEELKLFLASVETKIEQETVPPEPTPAEVTVAEPAPAPVVEEKPAPTAPAPAAEKPKKLKGFSLLIGCAPMAGWKNVVFAEEILSGIPGYWQDPNVWDRRGKVRNMDWLAEVDGKTIVQRGPDPDIDNLVSTLLPHATFVVQGTIR